MPVRATPFATGQVYHLFSRGIERRKIYHRPRDYERFNTALDYYSHHYPGTGLSDYLKLTPEARDVALHLRQKFGHKDIRLISYTLMPNHFHILVRQELENGITAYMKDTLDSHTKYFNRKYHREGTLFQSVFHAVRIESEEHMLHVHRYIHLNPLTSGLASTFSELIDYPWSSMRQYLGQEKGICETGTVLSYFQHNREKYLEFLQDNAEYQRKLHVLKHLWLE